MERGVRRRSFLSFVSLARVFTHVADKLHAFPDMGWGLSDSPGHYLDFVSTVLGSMLLIARIVISFSRQRPG
jgi:hypothetical protein